MSEELLFLEMITAFCENLDWRILDIKKSGDRAKITFETHIMHHKTSQNAGIKGSRMEKSTMEGRSRTAYGEDTDSSFFNFYVLSRFTYKTVEEIPRELLVQALEGHFYDGVSRNTIVSHDGGVAIAACSTLYSADMEQKVFLDVCGDMIRSCLSLEQSFTPNT